MIPLTAETVAARRRGYQRRTPVALLAFVLIVVAGVLPHVMVEAATVVAGRSLIPASNFFLTASPQAEGFSSAVNANAAGFGLLVTYLGLAFQQIGTVLGVGTFWVLIAEDVGRWVRRGALASGIFLILSSATVVLGYQLLGSAGVPMLLGLAWLPTLGAGLILALGARAAKRRLSSTWFLDSPELVQP